MKNIVIIGYGYVAKHVAALELHHQSSLATLTRNPEKQRKLQAQGIQTTLGDLDDSSCQLNVLPLKDAGVYYFAPPPTSGLEDSRLENFLNQLTTTNLPECIVYISTTGVYSTQGCDSLTDENSPTQPRVERGQRRLDAENKLLAWNKAHPQTRIVILRVVGIYGPDKLPLERIKRGEPLLDSSHLSFVNLIHIDDLAQACFHAMRNAKSGEIYNVSDGTPLLMTEYFQTIATAFNLTQPPLISMTEAEEKISPAFLSYLKESRLIDNRKILRDLNLQLHHPDARLAIKQIARELR